MKTQIKSINIYMNNGGLVLDIRRGLIWHNYMTYPVRYNHRQRAARMLQFVLAYAERIEQAQG